ncbi:uncharacterized protein F4807DRAFT_464515 [Annulohypoxylon truncatum]|uniref:uncharacterized protein n=1 Tax=Annulohypoxylon truncatum TaxID=327061 RepID=UPI0020078915|nr:uncharacterized protein F4807DRAFT_464515 [Annulohypoxylon truncatum]KAI1205634.1 hypothetical protein F4807DRAFT_464515 [Annulohypoxylon truncatum]
MRDVYSKADHVFVWLGEEDGTIALAISSIHAIVAQCKEETQNFVKLVDIIWADKTYTYSDAGLPSVCDWEALYSFFSSPWHTRLWPIQEVCLAKEAICHRGQHTILWSKIALAARWMYHRKYWTIGNQRCRGLDCAAEVYHSSGGPNGLYEHLQLCPYFDATDPRDKIFGLLGLRPPSSPGAEGQSFAIVPNYQRMSLKDVYAAAARVAIAEGSFVVLKRATFLLPPPLDIPYPDTLQIGSFPSWVPRLDGSWDARRGSPMPIIARAGKSAGGDFRLRPVSLPDDADVLLLRGLVVTKVARTSKPLSYEVLDDPAEAANVIRHAWAIATEQYSASYDARGALIMFIFTLTSAGRNANGQMIYGDLAHEQRFAAFMLNHGGLDTQVDKVLSGFVADHDPKEFLGSLVETTMNRCYIIGNSGEQALGPIGVQVDDILVIILGADVPFILRPVENKWRLIGDAYVHGIMEGEYIEMMNIRGILDKNVLQFATI